MKVIGKEEKTFTILSLIRERKMNYPPYEYKALHDVKKKMPSLTLSKSRMWGKILETRFVLFFLLQLDFHILNYIS